MNWRNSGCDRRYSDRRAIALAPFYRFRQEPVCMSSTVIIGAGPAGLSAAYELAKLGMRSTVLRSEIDRAFAVLSIPPRTRLHVLHGNNRRRSCRVERCV